MTALWIKRSAHSRRLPSGKRIEVRSCWILSGQKQDKQRRRYRQRCPDCNALIQSVHMPNGGWAHFEGGKGMGRIKHPCFNLGEGLSKKRDDQTPDLFADSEET